MRIKTQFYLSMSVFAIVLIIISVSVMLTNQRIERFNRQEKIAANIQRMIGELGYFANEYLLYLESRQRNRWETKWADLEKELSKLEPVGSNELKIVHNLRTNHSRMKIVFENVTSAISKTTPSADAVGRQSLARVSWSRLAVQNQTMASDALQMSRILDDQRDRWSRRFTLLVMILLVVLGAFFIANYLIVQRRLLRSLANLQSKTDMVGSGNLDVAIGVAHDDEVGDLFRAFNRMAANLKKVTVSKKELEKEMAERQQAEKALQANEAKYRNLFENMTEEVHFWKLERDENGQIRTWRLVDANPPALSTWGKTLEDIQGKTTDEIFGTGASEHFMPVVRKIMDEGVSYSFEDYFPNLDKHFRFTSVPIGDHFITTGADITVIKKAEEKLLKSKDKLEVRVAERTAELAASNRALRENAVRLKKLNQELKEFAFAASHDLQEPLRKIQTFCDMAKRKSEFSPDSSGQDYLDRAGKAAARMRLLLNALLQYSRVTTQTDPFKETDLGKMAREAADFFDEALLQSGGLIDIGDLPHIDADESQMLRLFQNLIGNALKYRSDLPPRIKIYSTRTADACEIFVEDNGIGFDIAFAEKIFMPFQRLHGLDKYDGTGMGLAICRKIVERHEGSIQAQSEPGKGSTFIIRLPLKQSGEDPMM